MQSYEVEIKSLLGDEESAVALRSKILSSGFALSSKNKQLNHYFVGSDLDKLYQKAAVHFSEQVRIKFQDILKRSKECSIRTRDKDGQVFLVVKTSVDDATSANGVTRMEFEEPVPLTLEQLDDLLVASGFEYQAKWSREREEYTGQGISVCLDKNAGYGWLAEFEKIVHDESELEPTRRELRDLMHRWGVGELAQSRLERMFSFYNAHWPEYYGTDKIFTVV